MDWKQLGTKLASIGLPLLGEAVGGPAGALVAKGLLSAIGLTDNATPEQAAAALGNLSGEQLVALRALEADVAKTQLQTAAQQVSDVNKTLQTEAMGGSFWQRNHHSFESSFVCLLVAGIYFILPIFKIAVPQVPESAWLMLGAVLGVTAWQRGSANIAAVKQE